MIVEITRGKIEGLQKGRLCVFKGRKDIEIDFIDVIMDLSTLESM